MGFYKDGVWQPETTEIASGEYSAAPLQIPDLLRNQRNLVAEKDAEIKMLRDFADEYNRLMRHMDAGGDFFLHFRWRKLVVETLRCPTPQVSRPPPTN